MNKMTIVNGVIQRGGAAPGSASEASPTSGFGLSDMITVYGLRMPKYTLLVVMGAALLLGGVRGGLLAALGLGIGYVTSNSTSTVAPTSSSSSSTSNPRRGGGLSNVRGVADLPKSAPKGG